MAPPILASVTKEWTLVAGEEFRFEVDFKNKIELRLKNGHAEYFGAELGPLATYAFTGENGAVFSWQGCTLEITGECQAYVGTETPMGSYINTHMALQQQRVSGVGPRVMIVGPNDSGKTSLARVLINYAVRQGVRPIFVSLDPLNASVTVPGTLSATPMTKVVGIEAGFMGNAPMTPLVWQFGHDTPSDNPALFKLLVDRLAAAVDRRADASGLIIDTRGTDMDHAIQKLRITTLLVIGDERMYHAVLQKYPELQVVKLSRSGGTVSRDPVFRQQANARAIRQYFYGTTGEPAMSFSTVAGFQDTKVVMAESGVAPSSTLPVGEEPRLEDTRVVAVDNETLTHAILAITNVDSDKDLDEGVLGAQAVGFVNVTRVDTEKERFTMISPVPGRLPKRVLLYGNVKWMETL
ncbi:Cleavage polyadenylation factor subunit clp1 [Coemansia spiralis]|uniref:Polynucleotide 5'-hydroxyl-kinase GRC3 n=2 Tax=Coemansia TaxID=4863 RepID=A0A9W8KWJ3_9FUNG|nr:Pre-mRNA cleavage complex II protein Clp1-domain-containing protein [Coemansia spiralis]KAJ1989925.1 Cleavage polyadenylation factor subunit clp1 [Coemansia umbellata]KAJ2620638.1 Cleavage polyadenylation factor subunit clp1 [Coemansia sp. RSA 1358]KAJ2673825.1 Cleavage polyadenylation factor subunit clp1 [Coemansia spiralis]